MPAHGSEGRRASGSGVFDVFDSHKLLLRLPACLPARRYGTLRIARNLPPGGRVVTLEAGEEQARARVGPGHGWAISAPTCGAWLHACSQRPTKPLPWVPRPQAATARQILEFAGVQGVGSSPDSRVQVLSGLSGDLLPRLRELAGLAAGSAEGPPPLSFVFLDHCKPVSGGSA